MAVTPSQDRILVRTEMVSGFLKRDYSPDEAIRLTTFILDGLIIRDDGGPDLVIGDREAPAP